LIVVYKIVFSIFLPKPEKNQTNYFLLFMFFQIELTHFQYHAWPTSTDVEAVRGLLDLVKDIHQIRQEKRATVIHCW